MTWLLWLLNIVLCAVVFYLTSLLTRRSLYLPPGPWRWPILGSLPSLGISMYRSGLLQPHQFLATLSKRYGKVFSLYLGNQLVIILNSAESVRKAFQNQHLADRPQSLLSEKISEGQGKWMMGCG